MTQSIRAEIIIAARDEATKTLAKVGQTGTSSLKDLNKGAADVIQRFTGLNIASLGAAAAIGGLAAGLHYAVSQAAEAEKIFAITEAVVKSTGGAAGLTAQEISNMAGRLSQLNAVDDEVILSAQNVLLTFKRVKGEAFEQASQAALDLSAVMGGDLRSSMMMIGKALEDPVRGITALRRAGVSFTSEQQKVIKALVETGRQAEAMDLILTEVNSQVGGAGAAAANTYSGQMALLKINVDNLAQSLGEGLLPWLTEAASAMNLLITWSDKLEAAMAEHEQSVLVTSKSYEEYTAEIARSRKGQIEYIPHLVAVNGQLVMIDETTGQLTKTEYHRQRAMELSTHETSEATRAADRQSRALDLSTTATSDLAHGYARMGEEATNVEEAMEAINIDLDNQAILMQRLVDAGLGGKITGAFNDYKDVISETQPEIDALNKGIEWMLNQQGKSYTVTTASTASLAEYELAQIRAATAAQKFAEYSGDSREEQLELQIASELAAEKVGKLGTEMGISQTFTADYTKRLLEANGELDALTAKQAAAEEQLRRTTAEFIQQNIILAQTPEAQLEVGHALGLIDDASYNLAKRVQELTLKWDLDGDKLIEVGAESRGLAGDLAHLENSAVTQAKALADGTVTADDFATHLNVYTEPALRNVKDRAIEAADAIGSIPNRDVTISLYENTYKSTYYTQDVTQGGAPPGNAMGGPVAGGMGQSYIVGEQGPELFTPATSGTITPNHKLGGGSVRIDNITITVGTGDAREISRQLAGELRRALGNGAGQIGA